MCGIAGFWEPAGADDGAASGRARAMAAALAHRGPDDAGVWADPSAGVALGFRRLAIVGLGPEGHQPMESAGGRYVIAFNGEVYNFAELRRELEPRGHRFRGGSDTEVMLAAIEEWGLRPAVERFVGMFAFALWDRVERRLSLVRDRLGIKPLYYGRAGGALVFGSELKALRAYPGFAPEVDRGALSLFLRHSCVPTPYTIYRDARKLTPGTMLTLAMPDDRAEPATYWSARDVAERGAINPWTGTDAEAADRLDALLREAVRLRMVADVPLGAFLSGGIDSSTVVALMQAQSARPVRTFTIGFPGTPYDEAPHARSVATHLGTEHAELDVTAAEAHAVIPTLADVFDEPFADSSQIPTLLVSRLARRHVTVSLSGDGGDELFGGYARYTAADSLWRRMRRVPMPLRRGASRILGAIDAQTLGRALFFLGPVVRRSGGWGRVGDKAHRVAEVLPMSGPEAVYRRLVSHWDDGSGLVLGLREEPATVFTDRARWAAVEGFPRQAMYFDAVSYLPDDILAKLDRASMACSLEARVPLLDHRVVEFAACLPTSLLRRDGQGKWLLRQVLGRYLPPTMFERPKKGFGVPIGAWLRGPLREWAEALLAEDRLKREGFLNPVPIRATWQQHLAGRRDWGHHLWDVLMFQSWRERWIS